MLNVGRVNTIFIQYWQRPSQNTLKKFVNKKNNYIMSQYIIGDITINWVTSLRTIIFKRMHCPVMSTIDSPSRIQTTIFLLTITSIKCQDMFYRDNAEESWSRLISCRCLRAAQIKRLVLLIRKYNQELKSAGEVILNTFSSTNICL